MQIKELDFSEYHDLFHNIWQCRGYPGGRRRHLQYRWDFQYRDKVYGWTWCKLGKHRYRDWFMTSGIGELSDEKITHRTCAGCHEDDPNFTPPE